MNSHFDQSDAEGLDLGDPYCSQCGEDGVRDDNRTCSKCGSFEPIGDTMPAFCALCDRDPEYCICEGTEKMDPDKLMRDMEPPPEPFDWNTRLNLLLDEASDLQLKAARYAVERAQAKRIDMAKETIRQLDPNAPKPRARRSDADKPRAPKAVKP